MNTSRSTVRIALLVVLFASSTAWAAETTIKLATLAPDGSVWDKAFRELGQEWRTGTDGRVQLRIYPGGVAGDDPDIVRKMRIGQLQGAALTITGLYDIDPAFNVLGIPMFYDSFEEFIYVRNRLTPTLKQRLEKTGFVLVHWGHGGWVYMFSKQSVSSVDDLRQVKIFTWAGDATIFDSWRANGCQPVALAATDIMMGLQTGMITALPSTPLAALSLQWFRQTPYMLDVPIAPLLGATVVTAKTWNKLSEEDRTFLFASAGRAEKRLDKQVALKDDESVDEMRKRGLTVVESGGDAQQAAWRAFGSKFADVISRKIPQDVLDEALRYRKEFREQRTRGDTP